MLFRIIYLLFALCCLAIPSKAAPILTEDFESGVLDPRISLQTVKARLARQPVYKT
jgi:hypothetical protein